MNAISSIIEDIVNLLKGRTLSSSPEVVAENYAKACESANQRLSKISRILEEGSEIEALQVAEQQPRLIPLIELLSFGEEIKWQTFCEENGHAVATLIDFRLAEELLSIYDKGLSPNHPLYREYRAAIRSKDDGKALELLRIISQLNPSDTNASKEIERLSRKITLDLMGQLDELLQSGETEEVFLCMRRIEEGSIDKEYIASGTWNTASKIRWDFQRKSAHDLMCSLLNDAESKLSMDGWREAAANEVEISAQIEEFGLPKNGSFGERHGELKSRLEFFRSEAAKEVAIKKVVAGLEQIADEVQAKMLTPNGFTLDGLNIQLVKLNSRKRELRALGSDIPDGAKGRIKFAEEQLTQQVKRYRKAKRIKSIGVSTTVTLTFLGVGVFGFFATKANSLKREIDSALDADSLSTTKSLIDSIEPGSLTLKFPSVVSKIAEAETWIKNRTVDKESAEVALVELEKEVESGFSSDLSALGIRNNLERSELLVNKAPSDIKPQMMTRFSIAKNEVEDQLKAIQEATSQEIEALISSTSNLLNSLNYEMSAANYSVAVSDCGKKLKDAKKLLKAEIDSGEAASDLASQLQVVEQQISEIASVIGQADKSYTALGYTKDLRSYVTVLKDLKNTKFSESKYASVALKTIPSETKLKAILVGDGDVLTYEKLVEDNQKWFPATASERHRKWVTQLREDPFFAEIYRYQTPKYDCLSIGRPRIRPSKARGSVTTSGLTYVTAKILKPQKTKFAALESKIVTETLTNKDDVKFSESPATALLEKLNVSSILNDAGTKFRKSPLKLIPIIFADQKCPAVAKAYLLGQIFRLIADDEVWGTAFSPTLIEDIKAFNLLEEKGHTVEAAEWMLEKTSANEQIWKDYFSTRSSESRFAEIEATGSLIGALKNIPTRILGRVDLAGKPTYSKSEESVISLGFLSTNVGSPKVSMLPDSPEEVDVLLLPLTPIVGFSVSKELATYLRARHPVGATLD